jgi:taurine dioxygenase
MAVLPLPIQSLPGATFGGLIETSDAQVFVESIEAAPGALPAALNDCGGLLVVKGLSAISADAELLVRMSRLFGAEVEDYAKTGNDLNELHPETSQIIRISNLPPMNFEPPAKPDPPRLPDGGLPMQFPHRRGWHTDQSFRRPPPDISLFYAHVPAPKGQGQTLYADGTGAYDALPADLQCIVENLHALHVAPFKGYGEDEVAAGKPLMPLTNRDGPQPQPAVRIHPETGRKSLYLCECEQLDWVNGPLIDMQRGINGDGAELVYKLMTHFTADRFTYAHDWDAGDLVVYDNRCTIHSATWFDANAHGRIMWRTTVWGNPGPLYEGEKRSWDVE